LDQDINLAAARRLRGGVMPHVPPAASPVSTRVRIELEAAPHAHPEALFTDPRREHGWRVALAPSAPDDSIVHHPSSIVWYADVLLPQEPTVLKYHFVLADGAIVRERRQKEGTERPLFGVWEERDFQIAVYDPHSAPPTWVPGSVIYQIFPDRFARGDPQNLRKGLEKTYSRPVLYMQWDSVPEKPSRGRDFYGGDLRGVINKLDYLQELGITCIYFTPIFASPTNHRYDAIDYTTIDPRLGTEDDLRELIGEAKKRGISVLLDGVFNHCSKESIYFKAAQADTLSPYYRWFHFTRWPNKYDGWANVATMPEFVECPEVEDFFFGKDGIAFRWLSLGTVGWRTDVTPWMTDEFWRRFRRAVRAHFPDAYLVAEDWGDATHRFLGDTFDATMNYRFAYSVMGFAAGKVSPAELDDRFQTLRRDTPPHTFSAQMNLLDSHDTPRLLTSLEGSRDRLMLAAALQLAYPGVPMLYYGTEAGLEGEYAEDGRRGYPWDDPDEKLLAFYKRAINARRASQALSAGDVQTVWIDDKGGYGFMRRDNNSAVVALFNNGTEALEAAIMLGSELPDGEWPDLLAGLPPAHSSNGVLHTTIPPAGAGWFQISQ
jgi:cyclomaltodextrinase